MTKPDGSTGQPREPTEGTFVEKRLAPRDYSSEALVGLALTAGIGVFALPFELDLPVRLLLSTLAVVAVLVLFVRFPKLATGIIWVIQKAGVPLLGALVLVAVLAWAIPAIRLSDATWRIFCAGATAAVVETVRSVLTVRRYRTRLGGQGRNFWPMYLGVTAGWVVVFFALGSFSCSFVRDMPGGEVFTDNWSGAILVGLGSAAIVTLLASSLLPALPDNLATPSKPRRQA